MSDILLLAGVFVSILVSIVLIGYYFLRRRAALVGRSATLLEPEAKDTTQAVFIDALRSLGDRVGPSAKHTNRKGITLRERLQRAGYRSPAAVSVYQGAQIVFGLVLGLGCAIVTMISKDDLFSAIVTGSAAFCLGYLLPEQYLKKKNAARRTALRRGLPNAIDLLVLSLEAGQTIDHTSYELSKQLRFAYPELAGEFGMIHTELRTGSSRVEALRNFATRAGEPEIRKLVNLLVDGDRFGTQLAVTLRTHARYMRTRMRQQAQEQARKIGVKMVFPLVLLIFPSLLLVTLGPALLQMQAVLGHMFDGF